MNMKEFIRNYRNEIDKYVFDNYKYKLTRDRERKE